MLQYVCEWCQRPRKKGERWILGFAAEKVGATVARREITITSEWSERWASHPLAVHFCSEKHKEKFIQALFEFADSPRGEPRRRTANAGRLARVSAVTSAGTLDAEDSQSARTASHSRRTQGTRRNARQNVDFPFAPPDDLRAHGLSVRLVDGRLGGDSRSEAETDLYGGA